MKIYPENLPNMGYTFKDHSIKGRSGHLSHALVEYAPGCVLADDVNGRNYPTPMDTSDQDLVFVGRVRRDLLNGDHGLALWCCGDQIRKGAATNCVEIAELLAKA